MSQTRFWKHDHNPVARCRWRDRKRYLWLLAPIVPSLAVGSWLLVLLTGQAVFWWSCPIVAFVVIPVLDHLVGADAENPPEGALAQLKDDRFYRWVNFLYLPGQYLSLVFACWIWANDWPDISLVDKLGLMVTVGIICGIAISSAHELGHQRALLERRLSKLALAQSCYGHFFVEHNRGHHVRVATPEDPASSLLGESLYAFIRRSVTGGVRSAWQIERARLSRIGTSHWSLRNDVLNAWLLSLALFTVLAAWFGVVVLPWLIGQAVIGFCMLETVNYLEHYGLRRQKLADGRYEPIRPSHSWNSNTIVANVCLFHLQRHSDHHAHPLRRYQTLRHADEAPQLPSGYATMMLIAMIPPLWWRIMDPRVIDHYGGHLHRAALRQGYAPRARSGPFGGKLADDVA
ncbi:MAG TPA: alkane 1-monooxygenase [Mycobacterium sp.]|jgi:alkane 1-monooxygenase|nr:alkane 1-monooxygenase [Mycobacterium sp.]